MQPYKIKISAHPSIELLERILRVIRHRGGEVCQLQAYREQQLFKVEIEFHSRRTLEYITQQLHKLIDIQQIETIPFDSHIKRHG